MKDSKRLTMSSFAMLVAALIVGVQVAYATPPRVVDLQPAPGVLYNQAPTEITATFDQAINATDIDADSFILTRSGGDGQFGQPNDEVIVPLVPPSLSAPTVATYDLSGVTLPDDLYQVTLVAAGPPGGGTALLFDGQDDYVEMPILPSYKVNHLTIEAWIYLNSVTNPMVIAGRGDDYNLGVKDGHLWSRFESPCGEWVELEDDDALPVGAWVHVAMTYDRSDMKLYVNGQESASLPWTQAISYCWGDWEFYIGRQNSFSPEVGGPRYFHGVIDEVRLWNVARTEQELSDHMYRKLAGDEAGLVGLWNLNDAAGQVAGDLTATGNDGRLGVSTGPDSADPTWVPSTAPIAAITNTAGEILDGEYTGVFPSGDGQEGGNFVCTFALDTTGPTVVAADMVDFTHVDVVFSEQVKQAGAETIGNYTITGSPAVLSAELDADGCTVHLETEYQADSTTYTLTVRNVEDMVGNPVVPGVGDTGQWTTPAQPPEVVSATFVDWTHADVEFSERVQPGEAEDAANYAVTPTLQVLNAVLDANETTVHLETAQQQDRTTYTVTVKDVEDLAGNAIVRGQNDLAQWFTGRHPSLAWLGVAPYWRDGVDPERGEHLGWYTWKVKYIGHPPTHVRLHLYRYGVEIANSPFEMNAGVGDPGAGQTFWYRRRLTRGTYTYHFSASDGLTDATGQPTEDANGPVAGNRPPRLEWAGAAGFETDGLDPEGRQLPGVDVTWQVKYLDREGDPPAWVRVHVARLVFDSAQKVVEQEVHGSPFDMTSSDTDYQAGAVFTYTRNMPEEGRYVYWFSAREAPPLGFTPEHAYGVPSWWHRRGLWVFNIPPRLSWAPGDEFGGDDPPDGLDPASGAAGSFFRFRVRYRDPDGTSPAYVRLHLLKGQAGQFTEVSGSPYTMSTTATDFSGPVDYMVQLYLAKPGNYRYRFSASDGDKDAIGEPSWHMMRGPEVTGSATAAVVSLSCETTGAGAAITLSLPADASVTAQVLNIAGRPVRALVSDRPMTAGVNALVWDGRSDAGSLVPAGVYLVRVRSRDESGTCAEALGSMMIAR